MGGSEAAGEVRVLADELLPLFYEDLRRIGRRERRRVGAGATMQTTALVNEAYLKLRKMKGWTDDRHFLCAAALAMRHALVNHAKAGLAQKRGSGAAHLSLTQAGALSVDSDEGLIALSDALELLAQQAPRPARVVECRYFGGYSEPETARVLGISEYGETRVDSRQGVALPATGSTGNVMLIRRGRGVTAAEVARRDDGA
ncbi:MAG: ECF-type sigma factor [Steroidobacteraceae bacterium]